MNFIVKRLIIVIIFLLISMPLIIFNDDLGRFKDLGHIFLGGGTGLVIGVTYSLNKKYLLIMK